MEVLPYSHYFQKLFGTTESVDMAAEYDRYWKSRDYMNALALWNEMQDLHYRDNVYRSVKAKLSSHPSIVSSFMPKSGGTFLHNRMVQDFDYREFFWGCVTHDDAETVYAAPMALEHYMRGGCTGHYHFLPSPHNLKVLYEANVRRIWVHIRDPREAVVSAFHHIVKAEAQGEGVIGAERRRHIVEVERPAVGLSSCEDELPDLNTFVELQYDRWINWLRAWLEFRAASPDWIVLTRFSDLRDPAALFRSLFKTFGASIHVTAVSDHLPSDRRRRSEDPWQTGLRKGTIDAMNNQVEQLLLGPGLIDHF